jgi:DNA-binding transcriptional regulator YbjK
MIDDITNAAMNLSQMQLANAVQTSVLDRSLDVAEQEGAAVTDLLQSSSVSDQDMGQRVDILA